MQTSPQTACPQTSENAHERPLSARSEDLAYQVVTIAAILLLLGSLWVFYSETRVSYWALLTFVQGRRSLMVAST